MRSSKLWIDGLFPTTQPGCLFYQKVIDILAPSRYAVFVAEFGRRHMLCCGFYRES
jgi:hypothetical protein